MKDYLHLSDAQRRRAEETRTRYKLLYSDPDHCRPMFIINTPVDLPDWEERLADPMVMLGSELDGLRPHLEIGDDRLPFVRVQFGTAQVAAAFGCPVVIPPNNLPAIGGHILRQAKDVYQMSMPDLDAGWYGKLWQWQALWLDNLPEGVSMQHPDIQSTFNSSHLIRGNDIMTDFYDDPEALDRLLDLVTDFMIAAIRRARSMITTDNEWFYDWGALWKGAARISNCSMHMIQPQFYRDHVFARDIRFFEAINGGRMHYCGSPDSVIDDFFRVPLITGLDYDPTYHSLWSLATRAPKQVTLMQHADEETVQRLLSGDWPAKRNIILTINAASIEEAKSLLGKLRSSAG